MSKPKVRSERAEFSRRIYHNFKEILADFRYIFSQRAFVRKVMRELISYDFRERLMMVVTEVNGCRYCSYYHAKEALKSGISEDELKALLAGHIPENTPPSEYAALVYAQHWAEQNAQPDPEAIKNLKETYDKEMADAIHLVLRMIRMGNLSGNLFDFWLYKLSFGRFGLREKEKSDFVLN